MAIPAPSRRPSPVIRALQAEAKRRGMTAYRLAQDTGIAINTAQRLLDGTGAPTLTVVEAVAKALGRSITVTGTK